MAFRYEDVSITDSGAVMCNGALNSLNSNTRMQVDFPAIYKGEHQIMMLSLVSLETSNEWELCSTVLTEGRAPRHYNTPLPRAKRPASKTYGEWCVGKVISKRNSKLKKGGYTEEYGEVGYREPMALSTWDRDTAPLRSYIVQPKLDGVRCIASPDGTLTSRGNTQYKQLHISEAVRDLGLEYPLDCELYIPGEKLNIISGSARRGNDARLQLHVFDIVDESRPFDERYAELMDIPLVEPLVIVPAIVKKGDPSDYRDKFIDMGYEGAVYKLPSNLWQYDHRSKTAWKHKGCDSKEFMIQNVCWDENATHGRLIAFNCLADNKQLFKVVPSWEQQVRASAYKDWEEGNIEYCGDWLTVEYRGLTGLGTPNHAVGIAVRDYE